MLDLFYDGVEAVETFFGNIADWMEDNITTTGPLGAVIGLVFIAGISMIWG